MSAPAPRRSWVKQWWLWTAVAAVVTGTVIGLSVGLSQNGATPHTDLGEVTPKF
jgi:hypothetical protein